MQPPPIQGKYFHSPRLNLDKFGMKTFNSSIITFATGCLLCWHAGLERLVPCAGNCLLEKNLDINSEQSTLKFWEVWQQALICLMGFPFNDFLLSEHCLSVLYADCMPPAQVSCALESGERGQFPLVTVVHSSIAPWHGKMAFLSKRKQSLAGSYINGHLALSGHSHNCWVAVQFSFAFPPGEMERIWRMGRDGSTFRSIYPKSARGIFTLGQDSLLKYEGTEDREEKVLSGLRSLNTSFLFARLTENGASKGEQHHVDACLPELLPCFQLGQRLHDSQTFPKPPWFLLKGTTAWLEDLYVPLCQDLLGVHCTLHQQEKGGCGSLSFAARRLQEKLSRHTWLLRKEKTCCFLWWVQ